MFSLSNEDAKTWLTSVGTKSIDLVLIDPPYEISRETGFSKGEETGRDTDRFRVSMNFGTWDNNFTGLKGIVAECYRTLKDSGTMICFYDLWKLETLRSYFEAAKFKQIRFIEWIKTNPVPLNSKLNYLTNAREVAIVGIKKGKPIFHSEYDKGIYEYPICHDRDRFHPTQKPVELIKELILKHSNAGDTVLDCFSGSGTTAVAAIKTNRNFVGCEISEEYHVKSIQRLKDLERR